MSTSVSALFEPDGDRVFVPTIAATGPWHEGMLHGGAVAALLTGLLEHESQVLVRVLVELLGPVPREPLRAAVGSSDGGRRVTRQSAMLHAGDRPVARASVLRMRRDDVDLPPSATAHPVVFDPDAVPDLTKHNRVAVRRVGRECFDSLAMPSWWETPSPGSDERLRVWLALRLPVVAGRPASPVETVVAAADYAGSGTSGRLDWREWSFLNADLVVSLSRPPVGPWVGLECDGLLGRTGTGLSVATLHDAAGVLGQSSQSIVIEPR